MMKVGDLQELLKQCDPDMIIGIELSNYKERMMESHKTIGLRFDDRYNMAVLTVEFEGSRRFSNRLTKME